MPDLVGVQYSYEAVAWVNENVWFIDKAFNRPNVPQAIQIENLWRYLRLRNFIREDGRPNVHGGTL
jgi:hypothetical protein